jgi:hypothetical protein
MDCREFQSLILQVKVKHCFREANHCADTLAKFGATLQQFFFIAYNSLLVELCLQHFYDYVGVYYDRLRPIAVFAP